jgi:hypothetical protein
MSCHFRNLFTMKRLPKNASLFPPDLPLYALQKRSRLWNQARFAEPLFPGVNQQTFGFVGRSVKIGHSHAAKADRSNRRPVFTKRTQREIGLFSCSRKKSVERDRCQFFAVAVSSDFDAFEYIVDTIQRRLWPRRKLRGCLSAAADRS